MAASRSSCRAALVRLHFMGAGAGHGIGRGLGRQARELLSTVCVALHEGGKAAQGPLLGVLVSKLYALSPHSPLQSPYYKKIHSSISCSRSQVMCTRMQSVRRKGNVPTAGARGEVQDVSGWFERSRQIYFPSPLWEACFEWMCAGPHAHAVVLRYAVGQNPRAVRRRSCHVQLWKPLPG